MQRHLNSKVSQRTYSCRYSSYSVKRKLHCAQKLLCAQKIIPSTLTSMQWPGRSNKVHENDLSGMREERTTSLWVQEKLKQDVIQSSRSTKELSLALMQINSHHGCCSFKHMLITPNSANAPPTGEDIIVFHVYMGTQKPMFGKISSSVTLKWMCAETKEPNRGELFSYKKIYVCRLMKAVMLEKDSIKSTYGIWFLFNCVLPFHPGPVMFSFTMRQLFSTIGAAAAWLL